MRKIAKQRQNHGTGEALANLYDDEKRDNEAHRRYEEVVRCLLVLGNSTRTCVFYADLQLSSHMARSGEAYLKPVKRVFRYLKGTMDLGLCCTRRGKGQSFSATWMQAMVALMEIGALLQGFFALGLSASEEHCIIKQRSRECSNESGNTGRRLS